MGLSIFSSKELWIILFAIGAQLHFYGMLFSEIRSIFVETIGMGFVVISATVILILFNISGKRKSSFVGLKSN